MMNGIIIYNRRVYTLHQGSLVHRLYPSMCFFVPTKIKQEQKEGESLVTNGHMQVHPVHGYQLAAPHLSMTRAITITMMALAVLTSDLSSMCSDRHLTVCLAIHDSVISLEFCKSARLP